LYLTFGFILSFLFV